MHSVSRAEGKDCINRSGIGRTRTLKYFEL
jgi:hypothetical protein